MTFEQISELTAPYRSMIDQLTVERFNLITEVKALRDELEELKAGAEEAE